MEWSICNSNNESGLLKSNGPHRLRTTDGSFIGVRRPQVIKSTKSITIGEVKIYGTATVKENNAEKNNPMDAK